MVKDFNFISPRTAFYVFFIIFFVTGIFIYKDYGISWDETACRAQLGIVNWNWMTKGGYATLANDDAKYHGPAFDIILIAIEKALNLKETQQIYYMRHLVTFILFAIAVFFFYLTCRKMLKSQWLALAGAIMLVLSPRIFADAFYNCKDLAFTSFVIINIYTSILFLEKRNYRILFFHALISAIVVDIRIMGIIIPGMTYLFVGMEMLRNKRIIRKSVVQLIAFSILLSGFIILCWPVLWRHPLYHFWSAWKEMSKFPWYGNILYRGSLIYSLNLPWHYIPVYILITTPLLYIALFIFGIAYTIKKWIRTRVIDDKELFLALIFFIPVLAVIFLHSVVYDGWRHLYFVYPSILIFAMLGLKEIIRFVESRRTIKTLLYFSISAYFVNILLQMIALHPYEQVYFNKLAGRDLSVAKQNYEGDYWGLSYKEGLENILRTDKSDHIKVYATEDAPLQNNWFLLSEDEKSKIEIVNDVVLADYYFTAYRFSRQDISNCGSFQIERNNGVIFSSYDLRKCRKSIFSPQFITEDYYNTFSERKGNWDDCVIINDSSGDLNEAVELIDTASEYCGSIRLTVQNSYLEDSINSKFIEVTFDYKVGNKKPSVLVLEADSSNGRSYLWKGIDFQTSHINVWTHQKLIFPLPSISSTDDKVMIYFWNKYRSKFLIDNMKVKIFSIPVKEVDKTRKSIIPL